MAHSGRKSDSVMWLHFTKLLKEDGDEDFRKARCNHCEKVLSRGKADTPAGECSNSSMWSHMRNKHKTELEGARKENMSAIWFFSRHAVFRNFSTPKTRSCFGIKVQNLINLSSGTDYLSLPKLLTEIWPLKPHF